MHYTYLMTPFLAWFIAGLTKFAINSIKHKQMAFKYIGYGGLPSNHSAIVTSIAALIAIKEGINHPAFGVSVALAFIVMLDAHTLRRQVGKHAVLLNKLSASLEGNHIVRERMGHSLFEIAAGAMVGIVVAFSVWLATSFVKI